MKKRFLRKYDYLTFFIGILACSLILVVLVMASTSKNPPQIKNEDQDSISNQTSVDNSKKNAEGDKNKREALTIFYKNENITNPPTVSPSENQKPLEMVVKSSPGSIPANGRVKFKISNFKKLALQPLEFEVFDESGKPLKPDDLKVVQEYRMHFMVISADLKEFQLLHPTFEKGKWKTLAYMPTQGTYYAYTDIAPINGNPVVLRSELVVREVSKIDAVNYPELSQKIIPNSSTDHNATSEINTAPPENLISFQSDLMINDSLKTVKGPLQTNLYIIDPFLLRPTQIFYRALASDKKTLQKFQPFMGSLGHMVLIRHGDPDSFAHLYALKNTYDDEPKFATTFTKPGTYTAFVQLKANGRIYTLPFTFEIS